MTPDEHASAIQALQQDASEIKAVLNNGLRSMVHEQRSELATLKADIQLIRDALTGHVAKEYGIYEICNTGVAVTGALIMLVHSIIEYSLVNPVLAPDRIAGVPSGVFISQSIDLAKEVAVLTLLGTLPGFVTSTFPNVLGLFRDWQDSPPTASHHGARAIGGKRSRSDNMNPKFESCLSG